MKVVLNDFIGVRGRSGSSRGAALIASALRGAGTAVHTLRPNQEPKLKVSRLLYMLLWDFLLIPLRAAALRAEIIVHATNTGVSFGKMKSVVVVHDTMVLDHADMFNKFFVLYAKICISASVRRATAVVTPSEHSKRRIQARWPKSKIYVVPWPSYSDGPAGSNQESSIPALTPKTLNVLVVSSMDKHKRLTLAVKAVQDARTRSGRNLQLTLVARSGNDNARVRASISEADPLGEWITVRTGIDDRELSDLYAHAFCVLVSSIDEGFCLPALEATAHGVPVVHTNRGALPEVIPRGFETPVDPADDLKVLSRQLVDLFDNDTWRQLRDADRLHSVLFEKQVFENRWRMVLADQVRT